MITFPNLEIDPPDTGPTTHLTQVGNEYFLDGISGSGPSLKYGGALVVAGQFGAWAPIGAVQTASGYDVAWKIPGANEYTVWSTDSNGNYIAFIAATCPETALRWNRSRPPSIRI